MNRLRYRRLTPTGVLLFSSLVFAQTDPLGSADWTLEPYESIRDQFVLDIPETWYVVDQTPYRETGVVAFYSKPLVMRLDNDPAIRAEQERQMMALADDLMSGAAPAFFLDRYKASTGMNCNGYTEQAQKRKLKIIANAPALARGTKVVGQPDVSIIDFAGCKGLRILMTVRSPGRENQQMLVYTAAANDITYDFVLLTETPYFEQNRLWFERVVATAKLTAAH